MIKNYYKGKFIVFEGLNGSGKSTHAKLLADFLMKNKYEVVLTGEPTQNSVFGKKIKAIVHPDELERKIKISSSALQQLFAKDRKWHLEKVIVPGLSQGKIVISDRYFFASFAFGAAEGVNFDWLIKINDKFLMPDLTFILKVNPKICISRLKQLGEKQSIFEEKGELKKVWKVYQQLPKSFENVYIIEGERPAEKVFSEIKQLVISKLNLIR